MRSIPSTLVALAIFAMATPLANWAGEPAKEPTAATAAKGKLTPATDKDAAFVAKQKAEYPVTACPVSGEKLGVMGKPADYIYRVEGKPDRLITFCCKNCVKDFEKDPDKYLGKSGKPDAGADDDADHQH